MHFQVFVQRGITGDVKFTLSGYRNITRINVKQISDGKELLVRYLIVDNSSI